jgi:hypothetical protein
LRTAGVGVSGFSCSWVVGRKEGGERKGSKMREEIEVKVGEGEEETVCRESLED